MNDLTHADARSERADHDARADLGGRAADADRGDRLEARIRRRVRARMGWLIHAFVYACVIGGLIVLGFVTGRHVAGYAAAGWGLGLAIHGAVVWLAPLGESMQARMIARERARMAAQGEGT